MRYLFLFLLSISSLMADSVLREEVGVAVKLIDESQGVTEILNSQTTCPTFREKSVDITSQYCLQRSSETNEVVENTSLADLRRIRDEAFTRVCSSGCISTDFGNGHDDWRDGNRRASDWYRRNAGAPRRGDLGRNPSRNHIRPERYMDDLIPEVQLNYFDERVAGRLKNIHDRLRSSINGCPLKNESRFVAAAVLAQASQSSKEGNFEEAQVFMDLAEAITNFTEGDYSKLDQVRSMYEFLTGKNFDTGAPISETDMMISGMFARIAIKGLVKGFKGLVRLGQLAKKYLGKAWTKTGSAAQKVKRTSKNIEAGKWKEVFEETNPSDFLKNKGSKEVLEKFRGDKGIPKDWNLEISKNKKGVRLNKPGTSRADEVRIMPGQPDSPFKNSRKPYVTLKKNGKWRDINGNVVDLQSEAAHIPLDKFTKLPDWLKALENV